jgi:hypothetical protein
VVITKEVMKGFFGLCNLEKFDENIFIVHVVGEEILNYVRDTKWLRKEAKTSLAQKKEKKRN